MDKKRIIETIKTITIAVLVAGVIGFLGGVRYEKSNSDHVVETAKSFTSAAATPVK